MRKGPLTSRGWWRGTSTGSSLSSNCERRNSGTRRKNTNTNEKLRRKRGNRRQLSTPSSNTVTFKVIRIWSRRQPLRSRRRRVPPNTMKATWLRKVPSLSLKPNRHPRALPVLRAVRAQCRGNVGACCAPMGHSSSNIQMGEKSTLGRTNPGPGSVSASAGGMATTPQVAARSASVRKGVRLCCLNCRGLGNLNELAEELRQSSVDICLLQETRRQSAGTARVTSRDGTSYAITWSGAQRGGVKDATK